MRRMLLAALCAAVVGLASFAAPSSAKTVNFVIYTGKIVNGVGTSYEEGNGEVNSDFYHFTNFLIGLAIHQSDGHLLVFDNGYVPTGINPNEYWQGVLSQFTGSGIPEPFPSLGVSAIANIPGYDGAIAVDNSAAGSNGNIYVKTWTNEVFAYDHTGTKIGGNFPITFGGNQICGLAVDPDGDLWVTNRSAQKVIEFNSAGSATGVEFSPGYQPCAIAIDSGGSFYVGAYNDNQPTKKFSSTGELQFQVDPRSGNIAVDPANGDVYVERSSFINAYKSDGSFITSFGKPDPDHEYPGVNGPEGMAVNASNHEIYVANSGGILSLPHRVDIFEPTGDIIVPDVTTGGADVAPTSAVVHGTINPDGVDTTDCYFEYGPTAQYSGGAVPCNEGKVFTGSTDQAVSAEFTNLTPGTLYHYRLVSNNENGISTPGLDQTFKPQGPPVISNVSVGDVNTDNALMAADIDPSGAATTYRFEIGTDTSYGTTLPEPDGAVGSISQIEHHTQPVGDTPATRLTPGETYHFRVVATNELGTTVGEDHFFHTFPSLEFEDNCPNAHERQQTGAALLMDCRAYELVSAKNAAGYDVRSDVVLGQNVLTARPDAADRVLYSLHHGKVPGVSGSPTNFGLDPYVADRGDSGWDTEYVGLPADGTPATSPFGSPLAGSDDGLSVFAFAGQNICQPCFTDGSTGIPLRRSNGSLVQGMSGSLPVSDPEPAGKVLRPVSADGSHFVFGSKDRFEPDAIQNEVTIYDRNLQTGTTNVVSKTPGGATMSGAELAQLDISDDGSRILIGQVTYTDPIGVDYYHIYMNVGASDQTIDVTPGVSEGARYAGMSGDGSMVYFTTVDKLLAGDTDTSADLYRADVTGSSATLTRVSTGTGAGDTDVCNPVPSFDSDSWTNIFDEANCDVIVFAGGAGVASGNGAGAAYFLSPEKLDGSGVLDAPNLFVARPGSSPQFIATLEGESAAIHNALVNGETHTYADIQTTPDGNFVVFDSRLPLTNYPNDGHAEIYRYDVSADQLDCASCAPTRATATADAELSESGLNLSDDGRVFFSSAEQLVLRDTNAKPDAYEWGDSEIQLISTGGSPFASGLLSVSSNGVNAYFFTRATIVPEDENGSTMKIYVAREGGGFATLPPPVPCQASDECHGPGTVVPPPPSIGTFKGTRGNETGRTSTRPKRCPRGKVKRKGRCVKKKKRKKRNRRRQGTRRHG
jgi:hypothetical protein